MEIKVTILFHHLLDFDFILKSAIGCIEFAVFIEHDFKVQRQDAIA